MPFLEIVTKGRGIPQARLNEVAHHYHDIGGRSPINEITRNQAAALERELGVPVYIGQRNWHPFLEDTLTTMAANGIQRAVGFITAAHRCEASLERYLRAVETARSNVPRAPIIDYVNSWYDHPLFIEAICAKITERLSNEASREVSGTISLLAQSPIRLLADIPWVFTAHSIPCSMAKESPYVEELTKTATLVCAAFGRKQYRLAYSSRSGRPEDPWLVPDVCDVIREEAAQGNKKILFIPIGFIADHVEVLYDLDIEAQAAAKQAGVTLFRAQTVGDHTIFAQMMADVVRRRAGALAHEAQTSSEVLPFTGCFCFPGSTKPPCRP